MYRQETWVRNNDKTKARAEEREKNIGWIKRLFCVHGMDREILFFGMGGWPR